MSPTYAYNTNIIQNTSQSIHITYLEYNPTVHSMMEILQDGSLGRTLHNPWVTRGWWRIGTLGAKSPKKRKIRMRKKRERKKKLKQKTPTSWLFHYCRFVF